jgi:hypothetical protein
VVILISLRSASGWFASRRALRSWEDLMALEVMKTLYVAAMVLLEIERSNTIEMC